MNVVRKRSVTIRGHATSYSVEDPFHEELVAMAADRGQSLAALIAAIDDARPAGANLSSALRLAVVEELRRRASGG
ncbi:aryl-sulfate sulfotransferase [Nitratireductor mangrovi]|uniref:Aryl-sulfate sulfotransferase n=1 Tax=Nitratireductor mangrovi TaxID=2599600 RepID=A0A5B8KUJ1_9HYPH|nr:ribbon-helix-helix domain-containing protein [Nitratireductor mangrovi]QDY99263.1 aryl-sulfate sulfotransferase [Nitratireductor mangrovi]